MFQSKFAWLRILRRVQPPALKKPHRLPRPCLEALEDRLVPATLVVNSLDDADFSPGVLNLREAVKAVNTQTSADLGGPENAQITGTFGVNDTIRFAPALAGLTIRLNNQLTILASMVIDGGAVIGGSIAPVTIASAAGASRILNVSDGTAILKSIKLTGLKLIGGRSGFSNGGAIINTEDLVVTNCTFTDNRSQNDGGAIYNSGYLFVRYSTFDANVGESGGAISCGGNVATIVNSTFSSNQALAFGGAISGNTAAGPSSISIYNSTIVLNTAHTDGNRAGASGGIANFGATIFLANTIVAGNMDGVGAAAFSSDLGHNHMAGGYNNLIGAAGFANGIADKSIDGGNGNIVGNNGAGTIPISEIINISLANNGGTTATHRLTGFSIAQNAGRATVVAPGGTLTDQRGLPRQLGILDIGAVENYQTFTPSFVVDTAADNADGDIGAGQLSLREAILISNDRTSIDTVKFIPGSKFVITLTMGELLIFKKGSLNVIGNGATITRSTAAGAAQFRLVNNAYFGAQVELSNLTFTNGSTPQSANGDAATGGAIFNAGQLSISRSTFSGNNAQSGGAIATSNPLAVASSTLSNNTALQDGGSIFFKEGSSGSVLGTTITGNQAGSNGGGLAAAGGGAQVKLKNTIVAGNTALGGGDLFGNGISGERNLIGDALAGTIVNGVNGNIVGKDHDNNSATPRVTWPIAEILNTMLADNGGLTRTHALVQNSPAIGAGSNDLQGGDAYDQRETPRDLVNIGTDIGAYEVQHPLSPVGVPNNYARTFLPNPSPNADTAFIKGLYLSTLLRKGEGDGIAFHLARIGAGVTHQEVAFSFVNSPENRGSQVTFFYRYFLNREADPAGLQFHVNNLLAGADESTVMSVFILSPEYAGNNPSNGSLVNLLYYAVLGRQAETQGFNFHVNQLNTGAYTREQSLNSFLRSPEGMGRILNAYFASYIKRTIPADVNASFLTMIQNGRSFGSVAALILGSNEFYAAAGNNL